MLSHADNILLRDLLCAKMASIYRYLANHLYSKPSAKYVSDLQTLALRTLNYSEKYIYYAFVLNEQNHVLIGNIIPVISGNIILVISGNIIPVIIGNIIPVISGNIIPVIRGNIIPVISGNIIPAFSGNITPVISGNIIPVISGNITPVISRIYHHYLSISVDNDMFQFS